MKRIVLIPLIAFSLNCSEKLRQDQSGIAYGDNIITDYWQWKPFHKVDSINPVLLPNPNTTFFCPVRQKEVRWEEKDVFNPAAVVKDGKIYMVYRAEDTVGKHAGSSRVGLAVSYDGFHFSRMDKPVLYPDNDEMNIFEWEGGCEDPRIVESEDGKYIMTYTSYDGSIARLCLAISADLKNWTKHGLVFSESEGGKYRDLWSKSGSIVSKIDGEKLIPTRIKGKYWMYWGDTDIFLATSNDLIHWEALENKDGSIKSIFSPRKGYFDSDLATTCLGSCGSKSICPAAYVPSGRAGSPPSAWFLLL